MVSSFLFEFFLFALCLFLFFIFHISLLMIFFQLFFKLRIQLCNIEAFVAIYIAIHLGLIQGLIQSYLLFCFLFWFHLLFFALDKYINYIRIFMVGGLGFIDFLEHSSSFFCFFEFLLVPLHVFVLRLLLLHVKYYQAQSLNLKKCFVAYKQVEQKILNMVKMIIYSCNNNLCV